MHFKDRKDAGERLAKRLATKYLNQDGIVYALPRGGVIPAVEIARRLHMRLDLLIARKIGHPYNPEYAIAAVTERGQVVGNPREIEAMSGSWFAQRVAAERQEARRRHRVYLDGRPSLPATGKIAILVDDGIATGLTMEAAVRDIKRQHPARLVVAVPVIPADTAAKLARAVDEVVALDAAQDYLGAVGAYYDYFPQVSDDEVIELLKENKKTAGVT